MRPITLINENGKFVCDASFVPASLGHVQNGWIYMGRLIWMVDPKDGLVDQAVPGMVYTQVEGDQYKDTGGQVRNLKYRDHDSKCIIL